jgi:hypothetical protein
MLSPRFQSRTVPPYVTSLKILVPSMKKFRMESIVHQFHLDHHLPHLILIPLKRKNFQFHKSLHHPSLRDSFHPHQYQTAVQFLPQFLPEPVYLHLFQLGPPTWPLLLLQLLLVGT